MRASTDGDIYTGADSFLEGRTLALHDAIEQRLCERLSIRPFAQLREAIEISFGRAFLAGHERWGRSFDQTVDLAFEKALDGLKGSAIVCLRAEGIS